MCLEGMRVTTVPLDVRKGLTCLSDTTALTNHWKDLVNLLVDDVIEKS